MRIYRRILALCLIAMSFAPETAGAGGKAAAQGGEAPPIPEGLYIRIRPLSNRGDRRGTAHWDPTDYNAQQILDIIRDLKPNCLERYTDGRLDAKAFVPVAPGQTSMTQAQFLNASMRAGAPGCVISPRLSLNEYDMGTIFDTARSLYEFPCDPPMRILSLDNWKPFAPDHTPQQIRETFERLRQIGWRRFAVNLIGGINDPQGFASIVEVGVKKDEGFVPDLKKLQDLKSVAGVEKRLLYIDFPGQMGEFMKLEPDRRARAIEDIAAAQQRENFTFVWPILQGPWDSKRVLTSGAGPYDGQSLYDVMKAAILRGRQSAPRDKTEASTNSPNEDSLFDGKSLKGWKVTEFGGEGKVEVKDGQIILNQGKGDLTGVTYTGDVPKMDYEVSLEAMRVEGSDFFCGLTFPVKDSCCSLIVGGWGGDLVGISSFNDEDASENETTANMSFEKGRWYQIRVRVTEGKIEAWIDEDKLVDAEPGDREISVRAEVELSQPFGIAAWNTKAALRDIRVRRLTAGDKKAP